MLYLYADDDADADDLRQAATSGDMHRSYLYIEPLIKYRRGVTP